MAVGSDGTDEAADDSGGGGGRGVNAGVEEHAPSSAAVSRGRIRMAEFEHERGEARRRNYRNGL
jgi:hypothetical protein